MSDNYIGRGPGIDPNLLLQPGRLIGYATQVRTDITSGSVALPGDDTIPQITEGAEFFSVTYTPKVIGSRLRISVQAILVQGGGGNFFVQGAIFVGGQANALNANSINGVNDLPILHRIEHELGVSSLATVTYSARYGISSGGVVRLNSYSAGRFLGGCMSSWMRVEEYGQ